MSNRGNRAHQALDQITCRTNKDQKSFISRNAATTRRFEIRPDNIVKAFRCVVASLREQCFAEPQFAFLPHKKRPPETVQEAFCIKYLQYPAEGIKQQRHLLPQRRKGRKEI
jgi:hypothetical protein